MYAIIVNTKLNVLQVDRVWHYEARYREQDVAFLWATVCEEITAFKFDANMHFVSDFFFNSEMWFLFILEQTYLKAQL